MEDPPKRRQSKKLFLFLFSLIVGFVIFWMVTEKIGWEKIVKPLSLIKPWQALIIFILAISNHLFNSFRWKFILKSLGYNLPLLRLAKILLSGFVITYLTPSALFGGEIFISYALTKSFKIPWQKSLASIIILRVLNVSTLFLFFVFGLFVVFILAIIPPKDILSLLIATIFGLAGILAVFYYRSFKKKSLLLKALQKLEKIIPLNHQNVLLVEKEVFNFFSRENKKMWQGILVTILNLLFDILRFWFIIFFLKKGLVNLLFIFPIFAFVNLAYLLPIPTALGSLEALQAISFEALTLGADIGTAFSLILRGADLSLVLIGLIFLFLFWLRFQNLFNFLKFKKLLNKYNRYAKIGLE
jgi:uncharacterized protein (TIRG00374 family)